MRKLLALVAVLATITLVACGGPKEVQTTPERPTSDIYVVDNANMLNDDARKHIIATGRELDRKYGAQVVVLTVDSVDGDLTTFATDVFRKWGVGNEDKNNGVLLLISKNDRKFRIEVGYGLEGRLPDSYVGTVLDKMKVKFKKGDYSTGTVEAYDVLVSEIYKEYGELDTSAAVVADGKQEVHESGFLASVILWFIALTLIEQGGVVAVGLLILFLLFKVGALDLLFAIIFNSGDSGGSGSGFGGGSSGSGGCSDDW